MLRLTSPSKITCFGDLALLECFVLKSFAHVGWTEGTYGLLYSHCLTFMTGRKNSNYRSIIYMLLQLAFFG